MKTQAPARELVIPSLRTMDAGYRHHGENGSARLGGWSCKRRVIVARRLVKQEASEDDKKALPLLTQNGELPLEIVSYEYIVHVSTMPYEVAALVPLYRERGDAENPFDELKNQWGWAGFTTQDMDRCQITARLIAQIYNWWSLYARLVDRERHREAVTTRPELLGGVARQTRHAGQTRISISLSHSKVSLIKEKLAEASAFLQGLIAPNAGSTFCSEFLKNSSSQNSKIPDCHRRPRGDGRQHLCFNCRI